MAGRTSICTLAFEEAVKAIKGTKTVMYKHGVWNSYSEKETETVVNSIRKSGYGADVDRDDSTGTLYVCIPCSADMW